MTSNKLKARRALPRRPVERPGGRRAAVRARVAAAKDSVTVSVVLALAAGEWSTEILAGANAAAKDLGGKVKVRVTGPTTFDPQRQAQMFLAELETKPDVLVVVNVAPPLFTQPALEAQARGANIVWINVPPMPEVKNALFVATDAFGMGQTGGEIVVAALEKSHEQARGRHHRRCRHRRLRARPDRSGKPPGRRSRLPEKENAEDQRAGELRFQAGPRAQFRAVGSGHPQDAERADLHRSVRRGRGEHSENPRERQSQSAARLLRQPRRKCAKTSRRA